MGKELKNILISHFGIPSKKIGSWNIMLTNLLNVEPDVFDYIVSPKPDFFLSKEKNLIINDAPNFKYKLLSKLTKNKYFIKKALLVAYRKHFKRREKINR